MIDPGRAVPTSTLADRSYHRDRKIVLSGIVLLLALSWSYTLWVARDLYGQGAQGALGPHAGPWGPAEFLFIFVMWLVMMTAMMVPSVSPTIVMFNEVSRKQEIGGYPVARTWVFVVGYLIAWTVFSIAAVGAQWGLKMAALLSPVMEIRSDLIGGAILLAAGAFQFSSLKHACLRHCRSPLTFFLSGWRQGPMGALNMGIRHGMFCVGCCWALMAVMFVGGVMNPLWLVVLALFVLVEKIAPWGRYVDRIAGVTLIVAGAYFVTRS